MKHIKPYKIFENASPNFPTTRDEVIEVCEKYEIENYTINDDLSIGVDGSVYLEKEKLEYLPLKFNYVSGDFSCYDNKLKSLEGCPQTVGGRFNCYFNELVSLEGSPQTVNGDFNCFNNKLESLEGSPKTINGDFDCSYNKLTDLEYFPEVNGSVTIYGNIVNLLVYTFVENANTFLIENANAFLIEDFVDYEIVRNGDTVMLDRLQTFIRDNNLRMPELEPIKNHYKIIE
jgi:hypothetical protein